MNTPTQPNKPPVNRNKGIESVGDILRSMGVLPPDSGKKT